MIRRLAFILLFLCPATGWAQIALVGYTAASSTDDADVSIPNSGSTATTNCTTSSCNTTGANLIVIILSWYQGGSRPHCTLSDNMSNSYTGLTASSSSTNSATQIYYVFNATVGSGHTWTCATPGRDNYPTVSIGFFSGAQTSSNPFDQQNVADGVSITSLATGSTTPSANNELIVTGCTYNKLTNLGSFDSSMTQLAQSVPVSGLAVGSNQAYLVQTSASAINPTCTITNGGSPDGMSVGIATFKAAPIGPASRNSQLILIGVGP